MNSNTKSVLISHVGIPSKKIGSWNVMLTELLEVNQDIFDYIISPEPSSFLSKTKHLIVQDKPNLIQKVKSKVGSKHQSKKQYWKAVRKLIRNEGKVVLNIIDNTGVLKAIHYYAIKERVRDRIYINFFFHGYHIDLSFVNHTVSPTIDKLILLTNSAYKNLLKLSYSLPFEVVVLPNGVSSNFFKVSDKEKATIRKKLGLDDDKIYFLWLSQDRPKKGLKIILKAWKKIVEKRSNLELLVIGMNSVIDQQSVHFLGRIPNNELPQYYQSIDYYLFPTLWNEGFGLSLVEALKSGAKCIASKIEPIPEVLDDGNLGFLVDFPNMIDSWVHVIAKVLDEDFNFNKKSVNLDEIYKFETWIKNFVNIVEDSKSF